jgi:hypothetical protein
MSKAQIVTTKSSIQSPKHGSESNSLLRTGAHRLPESPSAFQLGKIRIGMTCPPSNDLMSEHAFFEYRALLVSTPHVEEKGEPIHCLIKMKIADQDGRLRHGAELEQEAGDLILFLMNPGPHRRISHSSICKADERRLHELGPATDFNRVGNSEIYFMPPDGHDSQGKKNGFFENRHM